MNKQPIDSKMVCSIKFTLLLSIFCLAAIPAFAENYPALDPPSIVVEHSEYEVKSRLQNDISGMVEWTLHKTSDGSHPNGNEQQMMWLMNRARANPEQEGIWLADTHDSLVISAINYFHVDLDLLMDEFAGYASKPPAAFDLRLYNAAKAHSDDLIVREAQDHDQQFARVTDAGFVYRAGRGNVFSYGQTALHAHAAFNIDWGYSSTGMQDGRGHRMAIMSVDGNYTNVGIAAVPSDNAVGPLVVTGNYMEANTNAADHYNIFIVGTVWDDLNQNNLYDPDEGLSGVTVVPDRGAFFAVTSDSGGYAIPVSISGEFRIEFQIPDLASAPVKTINIIDQSVLCDFRLDEAVLQGDMDGDGDVDGEDAALFAVAFKNGAPEADLNQINGIDQEDLEIFAKEMGTSYQT